MSKQRLVPDSGLAGPTGTIAAIAAVAMCSPAELAQLGNEVSRRAFSE